jgi:hypothetical protein
MSRVRLLLSGFILLLLSPLPLRADEQLQRVQRELRARKYYFGPVDGAESPEAKKAIEEFQRAKALDATGEADEETLRALGLRDAAAESAESRALKLGREWLARFFRACDAGDWTSEERFYAEKVRYFSEGEITRAEIGRQRVRSYELWPARRHTPVVSYATWNPRRHDELWVSTRVRHEMKSRAGERKIRTEELLFILRQVGGQWCLVEAREWPLEPPKSLP